jgi:hypothetical protein
MIPLPLTTSHPIINEITISKSSKTINNLCLPYIRSNYSNMRYDIFLENIATHQIKGICITTNQRYADIIMKDNAHTTIYFPENYDIINYLLQNNIPTELHEENIKPSIIDIVSLMLQVSLVRIISQLFSNNSTNIFDDYIVKLLNSDFYNSIQYLYSFSKSLSTQDIEKIIRIMSCNLYIKKRDLRKVMKLIS